MALNMPHNLVIADNIVDIKISGFSSTVTLGFFNPAGMVQPVTTINVPTDVLHSLGHEILNSIKENSVEIKAQHKALDDLI